MELGAQTTASLADSTATRRAAGSLPNARKQCGDHGGRRPQSDGGSKNQIPQGLEYVVALDTTLAVTSGIKEIEHTIVEALVLVIFVVFFFFRAGERRSFLCWRFRSRSSEPYHLSCSDFRSTHSRFLAWCWR